MATGNMSREDAPPGGGGLAAADRPSEKLLNTVAQNVIYDNLPIIAADLGVNRADLSRIKANFCSDALMQIFEVI